MMMTITPTMLIKNAGRDFFPVQLPCFERRAVQRGVPLQELASPSTAAAPPLELRQGRPERGGHALTTQSPRQAPAEVGGALARPAARAIPHLRPPHGRASHFLTRADVCDMCLQFELEICDVRNLPHDVKHAVAVWDRGKKALMTAPAEVREGYARWDAKLAGEVTLFSSRSSHSMDSKLCRLDVYDADAMRGGTLSGRIGLIASCEMDLTQHALPLDSHPALSSVKQLTLRRVGSSRGGDELLMQLQLRGRMLKGSGAVDDDASSVHSNFSAHSTSDAQPAHGVATGARRGVLKHGSIGSGSWAEGEGTPTSATSGIAIDGSAKAPAWSAVKRPGGAPKQLHDAHERIATLEQQLAQAHTHTQSLEATVGVLRHRLQLEVLEEMDAALERGRERKPADAAAVYEQQLRRCSERLGQLIAGDGSNEPVGSEAEREVVHLRSALASERVQLAEISLERDEYRHLVRKLGMQLPELAMASERGGAHHHR